MTMDRRRVGNAEALVVATGSTVTRPQIAEQDCQSRFDSCPVH